MRFRRFCSGSLALASLGHACQNLVPAFPQRSPPWLLTTAACGGLRSAPDHRTRRALLHLSYSCAAPVLPAMLVTHDPLRKSRRLSWWRFDRAETPLKAATPVEALVAVGTSASSDRRHWRIVLRHG